MNETDQQEEDQHVGKRRKRNKSNVHKTEINEKIKCKKMGR